MAIRKEDLERTLSLRMPTAEIQTTCRGAVPVTGHPTKRSGATKALIENVVLFLARSASTVK
jgi:hypothetical protein